MNGLNFIPASIKMQFMHYLISFFFFFFPIDSAGCIFEQKTSDVTANIDEDGSRRGFTSAVMLASDQGLLCVTADQQFLFYSLDFTEQLLQLNLTKRLVGYNEEIVDMKFIGDDEKFLALATNLEQVWLYGDVHFYLELVNCCDSSRVWLF